MCYEGEIKNETVKAGTQFWENFVKAVSGDEKQGPCYILTALMGCGTLCFQTDVRNTHANTQKASL